MSANRLKVECGKCRVAGTCPRRGSSPVVVGKIPHYCHLVGGYGREPVDQSILSPESAERARLDGPCLTLAEIPKVGDRGVEYELVKIFNHPVKHERE